MKNIYSLLLLSIFIFISCSPDDNANPTAEDVTGLTDGGATITVKLLGQDPDGDSIIYALESYASLGTGSVSGDVLTYTPNDNTNGVDNFSYRVYDSENNVSNVANITITITGNVNNPPTVINTSANSDGSAVTFKLRGSDPEGDSITFSIVGQPSKGSVSLSGATAVDVTATYTPNANAYGSDSFTFKANDGEYDSNIGTASITLPDAPDPDPVVTTTIFFSEYAEGTSNNKYLEIYNPTGAEVDLTEYAFPNVSNAPTTPGDFEYWNEFPAGAKIAAGGVYVIANPSADASIVAKADHLFRYLSNGDDGFKLVKGTRFNFTVIDVLGDWQGDPGSGWDVAGTTNGTKEHTLVRKPSVKKGNSDWDASRGTSESDSEWIVYPQNTWTYLGGHTID
ncbi:MAG: Ig-like domain-containing protein [Flavobacteriaceae bacterium]